MSKSAILERLAQAAAARATADGTPAAHLWPVPKASQARQHSDAKTLDWLYSNLKRNGISWELTSKTNLPKAVIGWMRHHTRAKQPELLIEPDVRLKLPSTGPQLRSYTGPTGLMTFGLSLGVAAIAETGSLVLHSGSAKAPSLAFCCEKHCVQLPLSKVYRFMEDYWKAQPIGATRLRSIHYISGPSRTADVEQTIQLGAHGPLSLHVLLVKA